MFVIVQQQYSTFNFIENKEQTSCIKDLLLVCIYNNNNSNNNNNNNMYLKSSIQTSSIDYRIIHIWFAIKDMHTTFRFVVHQLHPHGK